MSLSTLRNEDLHFSVCDTILLINTLNLMCVFYLHTDLRQTMVVVVVGLVEVVEDPHTVRREEVDVVLLLGESYHGLWCVFRVSGHDATGKTPMY